MGMGHSCGLQKDGTAFCWGSNKYGQLGNGSTDSNGVSLPVAVSTNLKFKAISAGGWHTCAIAADGTAWCWGLNDFGQLGNAASSPTSLPLAVALPSPPPTLPFTSISAGAFHSCAIDTAGKAFCWGSNDNGQIDAKTSCHTPCSPAPVPFGMAFQAISAANEVTCGITAGSVVC
jgi:alpha-tubulin suppressor-like RCC1 family protein